MSATAVLQRLHAVRNAYGAEAETAKRAYLGALRDMALTTAGQVTALHEDLLFIMAFPGSAAVRNLAARLLRAMAGRVRALPRAQRERLDDSGIAASTTRHVFPFPVACWLARLPGGQVEIDWRNLEDAATVDPVVSPLLAGAEREAFDSGEYRTREFIAMARPRDAPTDFQWLMDAGTATPALKARVADAWDGAEVPVAWRLGDARGATTRNMLPPPTVVLRERMRKPDADPVADIARPLASVERLPRPRAERVIATARAALAARCREVNAMTYPNADEVWWCDLDAGVAMAVIGIAPTRRLTLETNTGYLLLANGVPIGYGGVTPLYRQANTGINIFDPFRGSEAAFMWAQMLRAFRTLYGSRRFIVNAYQFGAGNAEAIQSGAFWFYYRLGFRPAQAGVRTLAAREAARMAADRKYRCDTKTLRRLATGDLHLDLPDFAAGDHFDEVLLPRAGALAARVLAAEPARSRERALRNVTTRVALAVGLGDVERWNARARAGLALLAPVVAGVPGIHAWSDEDKAAIAGMLRAKGEPQERGFAHACAAAPRFFSALRETLART